MNKLRSCILAITFLFSIGAAEQRAETDILLQDTYHENLYLRPLLDGKLLAHFNFTTIYRKDIKSLRWENQFQVFPLPIGDLVAATDLNRLHFSITKGNWNYRNWGSPVRASPPGGQMRVQLSPYNENPQKSWRRLVNLLSGRFCSSLTSKDNAVATRLTFSSDNPLPPNSTEHILYTHLPEESLCTANLVPWKKLLPCQNKGLASLLTTNLFKTSYSTLAVDLEPVISEEGYEKVQLSQSFSVIFNPLQIFEGKQTWSLIKIFGSMIQEKCPLATHSKVHVDITDLDDKEKLYPKSYVEEKLDNAFGQTKMTLATFDVTSNDSKFNLGIKQTNLFKRSPMSSRPKPLVQLQTHIAGFGSIDGTIVATITNDHDTPIRITYMDSIPHQLRIFFHTLSIRTSDGHEIKPDRLNFDLPGDRFGKTLVEFSMVAPPKSKIQISYDFERVFLRWTEHKPDPHRGFLLNSIAIRVAPCGSIIYAKPLLVVLPTPDFSMPYNVLSFVSTVIGSIASLLITLFSLRPLKRVEVLDDEKEEDKGKQKPIEEDESKSTGEDDYESDEEE